MIRGTSPTYALMDQKFFEENGSYSGSYGRWDWNMRAVDEYSTAELINTYELIKKQKGA